MKTALMLAVLALLIATMSWKRRRSGAGDPSTTQVPSVVSGNGALDEVVSFASGSITIKGTLTLPSATRPLPAVVLVRGAGPSTRDSSPAFLRISSELTALGIACLRYDKRGTGESSGNFEAATSSDFADDAIAAINFLKSRPEIDSSRIGIIGHSEGGAIVLNVASREKSVALAVSLAGPALPGALFFESQLVAFLKTEGKSSEEIATKLKLLKAEHAVLTGEPDNQIAAEKLRALYPTQSQALDERIAYLTSAWRRFATSHDPRQSFTQITCPVLMLFTQDDWQVVAADNAPVAEECLKRSGLGDYSIVTIPGVNHSLVTTQQVGSANAEDIAQPVLETIKRFVEQRLVRKTAG